MRKAPRTAGQSVGIMFSSTRTSGAGVIRLEHLHCRRMEAHRVPVLLTRENRSPCIIGSQCCRRPPPCGWSPSGHASPAAVCPHQGSCSQWCCARRRRLLCVLPPFERILRTTSQPAHVRTTARRAPNQGQPCWGTDGHCSITTSTGQDPKRRMIEAAQACRSSNASCRRPEAAHAAAAAHLHGLNVPLGYCPEDVRVFCGGGEGSSTADKGGPGVVVAGQRCIGLVPYPSPSQPAGHAGVHPPSSKHTRPCCDDVFVAPLPGQEGRTC